MRSPPAAARQPDAKATLKKAAQLSDVSTDIAPPSGSKTAKNRSFGCIEDALVSHLANGRVQAATDQQSFRDILDALPAAIYTTDAEGRITHFNPACVEFSGRTPVLGTDSWCVTWKLYNPDGSPLPHDECPMAVSLKEGRAVRGAEAIAERPDGTRLWFTPYPTPLKDSSGKVIGAINMLVDITDRKLAEQEERRRTMQLAAFMETAAIGLHRVGPDGTILWANQADAGLLGYDLRDYVGRNIAEFHADQETISRMLARLKSGERLVEHEVRLVCRDGSIKFALVDSSALFEGGEFVHSQCFTTDITDRKRTHVILHEQAQQLLDLHRRKDEFIAMLSHELRNPLAPIANAVHLLRLDRGPQSEVSRHARSIIERQVAQLSRLVDDLLEVSRITSGKIQLRRELVAVDGIIERAVEVCRPLIEQRQHRIRITRSARPQWVFGDPVRLEQVLVNILNNAAKYTDAGGQLAVICELGEGSLHIRVRDNGIGIAPELLPKVFELFIQADRSLDRAQGGLGIGLALVKRLVEMHGGTVEAASTVGVGTEIVVTLPSAAPPAALETRRPRDASGHRHRVLVVDDNVDSADSLAMLLQVLGHEVLVANDGVTAISRAQEFKPSIAVLDIGMPGMTGYEIAKRLRASPDLARTTLIAFSGYGQSTDRMMAKDSGFDHHLVKPATVEQIEGILAATT
jgi:PAS domain S-box-containing protein